MSTIPSPVRRNVSAREQEALEVWLTAKALHKREPVRAHARLVALAWAAVEEERAQA